MKIFCWLTIFAFTAALCGCEFNDLAPAEMVSITKTQPLGSERSLQASVRFDVGRLEIIGGSPSNLYTVDLDYDRANYEPRIEYRSGDGSDIGMLDLRLERQEKISLGGTRHSNRLRLGLTEELPLDLRLQSGVGDSRLSLSNLKLAKLDVDSGVGGAKITSYDPNPIVCDRVSIRNGVGSLEAVGLGNLNFRELRFEGGVGHANLDFTGDWKQDADIRIQVGVGGVTVSMPRNLGVEVDAEKHFLSGLHLSGFVKRDSRYFSENYDKAKIRVSIRVATGVGGFRINWI